MAAVAERSHADILSDKVGSRPDFRDNAVEPADGGAIHRMGFYQLTPSGVCRITLTSAVRQPCPSYWREIDGYCSNSEYRSSSENGRALINSFINGMEDASVSKSWARPNGGPFRKPPASACPRKRSTDRRGLCRNRDQAGARWRELPLGRRARRIRERRGSRRTRQP